MSCTRCQNPKWDGMYPHCNDCAACRTCFGSGYTHDNPDVPEACAKCKGRGWMKKETKVFAQKLTANTLGVRIPMTISLQFTTEPMELGASAADLNKQPFLATITYAGYVSDGCVGGTESITDESGNIVGPMRIFIPEKVMQARVRDLIGKGVFAAETLDTHDNSVQVGQFVDAYMERLRGTEIYEVKASGFFDKRDNVDLIAKIIDRARSGELGFSYDLKEAPGHLDTEMRAGETILVLDDFKWRGATVLRRETAAYYFTQLAAKTLAKATALSAADASIDKPPAGTSTSSTPSGQPTGEIEMTKEELAAALAAALTPLSAEITKLTAGQAATEARFVKLEAAALTAGQKTPAQIEAERLAAEAAAKPATMTAEQLAAAVATATTTAVTAALKAAGIGPAAEPGNKRQTFSAAELQTVKRYGGDTSLDEKGTPTFDGLTAAINAINDNTTLTAEGKIRALDVIVPMRNQLQREAMGVN